MEILIFFLVFITARFSATFIQWLLSVISTILLTNYPCTALWGYTEGKPFLQFRKGRVLFEAYPTPSMLTTAYCLVDGVLSKSLHNRIRFLNAILLLVLAAAFTIVLFAFEFDKGSNSKFYIGMLIVLLVFQTIVSLTEVRYTDDAEDEEDKSNFTISEKATKTFLENAWRFYKKNQLEEALAECEICIQYKEHRFLEAKRLKANILFHLNRYAESEEVINDLLSNGFKEEEEYLILGNIYLSRKEYKDARSEFKTVLDKNDHSSEAWLGIAKVCQKCSEYEAAISGYTKAMKYNSDLVIYKDRAFCYLKNNELVFAKNDLEKAIQLSPNDHEITLQFALYHLYNGHSDLAKLYVTSFKADHADFIFPDEYSELGKM